MEQSSKAAEPVPNEPSAHTPVTAADRNTLSLIKVEKRFAGVVALAGVSLTLQKGEVAGLIGPNGSGKTTLLHVASGLFAPSAGEVRVVGQRMNGAPTHRFARAGVARTFQQLRLYEGMTVGETVEVGAIAAGCDLEMAREALSLVGIADLESREAMTLSYGDQRRVEIAKALAARPQFLLLDEPAAGMNEEESDDLLQLLDRVAQELRCGVLIVDHDLRLIMRLCQRIQVLDEGRTIANGVPNVVRNDAAVIAAYLGEDSDGEVPAHSPSIATHGSVGLDMV